MSLERLKELEMIDPQPIPPWRSEAFIEFEIDADREIALDGANITQSSSGIVVC